MPTAPENYKFGGGISDSTVHPLILVAMILAMILIMVLPRRQAVLPIVFMAFLVPVGQQLYIAGLHLFVLRILIMVGLVRAYSSSAEPDGPRYAGGWNGIDRACLVYLLAQAVASVVLFREVGALINQLGFLIDFLGGYLILRTFIRDEQDVYRVLKCLAVVTVPLMIGMVIEQEKTFNIFGLLGGVGTVPQIRDGKIRSQGTFEHSLMAGTFAATLMPALFLLWSNAKAKLMAAVGLLGATVMMWTSSSSTPTLAYVAGILVLLLFSIRKKMQTVRRGIVFTLIGLQLVMKAPVWFLIGRVDVTGSSSGYHRAELVDQFVHHFFDWWLIGVADSSSWGLDMFDVQNQYVNVGETGGLLAFIFFILVISRSFGMLGSARKVIEGENDKEWMLWCLGSAMFANVVGFFGVNYFDQSRMWWFILLAMISAICSPILQGNAAPVVSDTTLAGSGRLTRIKPPLRRPEQQPASPRRPRKLEPRFR